VAPPTPGLDIIGDVHGCADELAELLIRLGYALPSRSTVASHPEGRRLIFVGDLVNRGPYSVRVLELLMTLSTSGVASSVLGNHDDQLRSYLSGRPVEPSLELDLTLRQLSTRPAAFQHSVHTFLDTLPGHLVLDGGNLVVAHAGLPAEFHGETSRDAWELAVYGPSTGRLDGYGFPERIRPTPTAWAKQYAGQALVVHGHQAIEAPRWIGRTVNIDTNCSRGGSLTAFRYPESQCVSVQARAAYWTIPRDENAGTGTT
jgi:protein phosphatase